MYNGRKYSPLSLLPGSPREGLPGESSVEYSVSISRVSCVMGKRGCGTVALLSASYGKLNFSMCSVLTGVLLNEMILGQVFKP